MFEGDLETRSSVIALKEGRSSCHREGGNGPNEIHIKVNLNQFLLDLFLKHILSLFKVQGLKM